MIRVITGPMFSGKSARLIQIAMMYMAIDKGVRLECFKPSKDIRDKSYLKSRETSTRIEAKVVKSFEEIKEKKEKGTKIIIIDEAQFLEGNYLILEELSRKGYMIYVGGLRTTSEMQPFGKMCEIMSIADEIEILKARCEICGEEAEYTACKVRKSEDTLIGDKDKYYPICRKCLNEEEERYEEV